MIWTDSPPDKTGHYWVLLVDDGEGIPHIIHCESEFELLVQREMKKIYPETRWAGPIPLPQYG